MLPITAVLPVYHRVPAWQFERALQSLRQQQEPAAEVMKRLYGTLFTHGGKERSS